MARVNGLAAALAAVLLGWAAQARAEFLDIKPPDLCVDQTVMVKVKMGYSGVSLGDTVLIRLYHDGCDGKQTIARVEHRIPRGSDRGKYVFLEGFRFRAPLGSGGMVKAFMHPRHFEEKEKTFTVLGGSIEIDLTVGY